MQQAQCLPRRYALIQLPEQQLVRLVKTLTVPERTVSDAELERLQCDLACQSGMMRSQMEQVTVRREAQQSALENEMEPQHYEDVRAQ